MAEDIMRTFILLLFLQTLSFGADNPTAFSLMKEGNRYVGEQAKDRVVQVRSEKSVGGLNPTIWYVVYYDPTATFKAVEVKFGGGKMMDVKRPFRVIESVSSSGKEMDKEKLKVDSDKAIGMAVKEPVLENLEVRSVQAKLENSNSGPVWIIKLWASKLKNRNETADLGEITYSADDGKIIKNDIHPDRVD
jgi:hypothetical protein